MTSLNLQKTFKPIKLLLIVGIVLFSIQPSQAGIFSWLKGLKTLDNDLSKTELTSTLNQMSAMTTGTSEVIVSVNWPTYAGENYLRIYDPSNNILAEICMPSNCYNGANVSYSTTVNLNCLTDGAGYYIAMFDSYGDGWNGTGANVLVTSGGATVINNSGAGANSGGVTQSFTVSGGGAACGPSEGPGNAICVSNNEIGGIVFEDNNADGTLDSGEAYFENVSVALFDDNGQVGATQTTNSNGEYLFTGLTNGQSYRVEFTVPNYFQESPNNTNSKSSVQVSQAGSCDNSLGIFSSEGYCDSSNPPLVISCYEDGNAVYGGTGNEGKSLVSFPYNSSGATPTGISEVAKIYQVGSVWGVAYQPTEERMFASALLKRHVGFGAQGEGGVYVMDFSSGTGSYMTSFNLDGLTPSNGGVTMDFGSVNRTGTDNQLPNSNVTNSWDIDAFGKIGKVGIGDLDLQPDGKKIWLVNLNQRALVSVDVSNPASYPGTTNQYPLSDMTGVPSCANGVLRPWALAFKGDIGYVGCVCTGENGGTSADLKAYVLSFNPSNPTTLTTEIDFDLDYTRELAVDFPNYGLSNSGAWMPWANNWGDTGFGNTPSNEIAYAQPILGEIDFLDDGAMVLGFSDRFGFQMGATDYIPVSGSVVETSVDAAGDIIKVCNVGGAWVMEGGSGCSENDSGGTSALTNDGPSGTGEFFYSDAFNDTGQAPTYNHNETFIGGLKVLKGKNELIAGHYDPIDGNGLAFDLGIIWHNTSTGARSDNFMIIESGPSSSKGNNLGSIEAVCAAAPIEIGNYVWEDTDADGIQDPSESGIAGVTVSFTNTNDAVLGTTTTDGDGKYVFSNANVTGGIKYNTAYKVKIDLSNVQSILPAVGSVSEANLGNGKNDSDGTLNGATVTATLTTGGSGETTYAVDFGFNDFVNTTEVVAFAIQPTCSDNSTNNDGYLQISSVTDGDKVNWVMGSDYLAAGGDSDYANATTIGALPFQFANGLTNPTGSQDYTIRVFNGSSSSFKDTTLTMNEQTCTTGCNCVENLYLNDTGLGEVHKFSVDPTDGTITEIGSPWLSGLNNPHGLGSDLNGNLYIGDHNQGPVFKLDCDGGTVADNTVIWNNTIIEGLTNLGSVGNYIITNGHTNSTSGKDLHVLDACSGDLIGTICLNNAGSGPWSSDWGLQVFSDGTILATDGQSFGPDNDRAIWKFQFDPSMINSSTCVDALVVNDYLSGMQDVVGITSDGTYLYVLTRDGSQNSTLLKIDATTGALVQSQYEGGWDGSGYNGALGLVYAPSSGYIYVSGYEDCIAIVDPSDLSYISPGNGTIPSGASPKAISILKECCPSSNNMVIDTFVTTASLNDSIFLQELINCSGTICQGVWSQGSNNTGLTYNACANTVRIDAADGCGTFTLSSDGLGKNPQCGAFNIVVNIKVIEEPSTVIGNRIWLDENSDGVQDAGEPGIPNVVVELQDGSCSSGTDCPITITDADGGYLFKNVPLGSYTVKILSNVPSELNPIFDEDSGTSSPDMIASVIVTSDEYITADFGYNYVSKTDTDNPAMTATGALGNRIWNDVNADGIQDPGERGIPNITVNLLSDPDMDGVYTASGITRTTDEYGNYIFDDIAAGAYALEVVEAGITNAGFTTTPTADPDSDANNISEPITIAPGDVWLGGDFGYTSSGTVADIGSTVFIDVDGDGVYDANNDLPLAGVTVALVKDVNTNGSWDAGEKAVATTLTDATGVYLFADLPADNYLVVVTDVNNVINDLTNSVDPDGGNNSSAQVTLSTTDQLTQNFGYVPTGHVAGNGFIGDMVFLDADASNGFTAGDAGIEGVEVELLNDGTSEVIASTATNENGMYYFGNLADGTYRVKVVSASIPSGLENNFDPDGSSPANNEGGAVIITSASSNLSQDFGYKAAMPHSIAGTIWEDRNAEGTLDGTETMRFEGVTIELKAADDNIIATTTTAIDGTYSFTQIPDGTYTVEVTDTRDSLLGMWHSLGSDSESDPIAITVSGADVTDVDFGYYQKGASLGNLVWEDMNGDGTQIASEPGIPGVLVTLTIDFNDDGTDDLSIASTTDTDGLYRFDNLLLDENDNGSVATYNISLTVPSGFAATRTNINMNSMDQIDSDDPAGVVAVTNQGETDMMRKIVGTLEPIAASYDFGLTRTTSLGNLVWLDENGDGVPDAGEPGIANVRMDLYDGTNTLIGSTTTDAKGGYLFTNLSSGDYTVKLVTSTLPTGLSHQTYDQDATVNNETALSVGSREVTIADFGYNYAPASDTDMPVVSDLGALGDRIWIDANSNGRQDAGEAGIENVTVELWTDVDADGVYTASGTTTTTDATGHYIFDDLEAQAYVVKVDETTLPAGFTAFPTGDPDHDADNVSEPIMLAPGDVYLNMDFGYNLPTGNTIGSMIYVDANGDGVLDAEPGVAGVTVSLENSNGLVIATTVTDETGYYNFPGLPNGSYTVVVNDVNNVLNNLNNSGDPDGITARESNVSLSGGDELSENFGFAPNEHTLTDGLIGSRVFLDTDGNNAFTSGEPGIENVMMSLVDVSTARVLSTTLTDENGHYYFGGLAAGDYEVVLDESTLPVGLTNSVDPNSTIPVNESGTVTLGTGVVNLAQNFGYKATAAHTVSGTIWEDINADGDISNESGTELAGVSLALYDTDGNLISTDETDTNGDYSFAGLPDGDYLIKVTDTKDSLMGYWHSLGTDSEPDLKSVTLSGNDLMDVDFGYYIMGAAVGNKVWLDYNGNHAQDLGEPGLPSTKLTLEIDYDDDGIADVSATAITGMDGSYSFRGLLLDEDHNGVGASPDYELIVTMPDADMSLAYASNIADLAGGNDKLDSDNHAGQVVMVYQGQENVANRVDASTETEAAAYDFGYTLDCASPSVDYAMTDDGSDPANANQTTDYFATTISGDTLQEHNPQTGLSGGIQSWTYCEVDGWNYYYNPLDPNEYLFAIDHGSNTTEIEYIEIRVDDNASDRHVANAADATFVMVRDWYVKTKDNAPLTANVNIRFYFPPNEYKQMLDAAKSQATAWGLSNEPTEAMVKWFKKPVFDPDNDIVAANTTLLPFDITNLRGSATDANGVNTALAAPAVENTRNHIQFNGITGFSGGTAMIHINRAALPVELSQFYGKSINCKETVITWTSETEESFSHYELERSDDGVRFEQIEKIEGTGGALLNKTYQYTDYTIEVKNYYRLKMVDLDGGIEYSKVIAVTTECDDFRDVKLYPNPVLAEENTVILEFYNNEPKTTISIVNSFGQIAKEVKLSDLQEWNKVSLDISDLPSGVYSILIAGRKSASQLIVLE